MAAEIDKRNRAQEIALQAARQRDAARKAAEKRAAEDAAARLMGFQNADDFLKSGGKFQPPGASKGGGGGGRGGGSQPRLTAKERNEAATAKANQAARRADSRGLADEAYARAERASAAWGDTPEQRNARIKNMGGNPNYTGHFDNPQTAKDVASAERMAQNNKWGKYKDATQENPLDNIKPLSKQSGSTPTTPSSDPADITPDIGGPDTSVPGLNWSPSNSTSSASSGSRNVVGFFKRNGKTIPITA